MTKDLTKGPILRTILAFVAPIFIGQMLQMTYNIVDSIVVGRFIGENPLAAVAATYTPISLFNAVLLGFITGASIIMAQYFGAGEEGKLRTTVSTTYIFVFIGGLLMTVIVFFGARPLLKYVLNTPTEGRVLDMAELYLRVYYAGAVFVFMYNMFAAALRSVGDSVRPLMFLVVACVANIVLDVLFVVAFKWGVVGVAAASVISQAFACIAALVYVARKHPLMWFKWKELVFDSAIFRLVLKMGIPEAVNSLIMSVCFMWQQRLINGFGPQAMAAYLAGQRVDQLVGMPLIITGSGLAPFAGQNIGAGNMERIYEGRRKMLGVGFGFALIVTPVLLIFGKNILGLFVTDPDSNVIAYGYDYLVRIAPFFLCLAFNMFTSGIMRGAGDTRFATINSIIGLVARIGAAYLLAFAFDMGLNGIWLSTGVGFAIGVIPTAIRWHTGGWKNKAVVSAKKKEPIAEN